MARPHNPTPPQRYPSLAELDKVRERVNVAALCREADLDYGAVKTLFQYEREPPAGVYKPLRKVMLRLAADLRRACGEE
ncbi:MAG: hypothetical protein AAF602_29170 [Myxococcota bacterium]